VSQTGTQATVYVVTPAGTIELRQISLGIQTPTEAEVLAGLREGELVVVSDRSGLKANEKVHPSVVQLVQFKEQDQQDQ
jgi:hypothetical protein